MSTGRVDTGFPSARSRLSRAAALLLVLLLALSATSPVRRAAAQSPQATALEHEIKAAFLYRFLDYVEWPDSAFASSESPIVLGVLGAEDVASELQLITQGRLAGGRRVQVRRLDPGDAFAGAHLLFVGRASAVPIARVARALGSQPTLLVTETEGALAAGSTINFLLVEGRVRFEVSLDAAERSGVRISSRMLAVAHRVRSTRQ